jgi:polyisoprenoid-binding protein YceI
MTDVSTLSQLGRRLEELTGTWTLDPTHTSVELSVRHMMVATVRGRVQAKAGTLDIDSSGDPERSHVEVEMDAASIDTGNEDRDNHLRSGDFLNVEQFPTMRFRSTRVDDRGDGTLLVRGNLTVRDVTRAISLETEVGGVVQDPWGNARIGFSATASIDRTEFGLRWNAAIEGGGLVVGDKVKLVIDAEFIKPSG